MPEVNTGMQKLLLQLKPRMVMTPLAISPPSSTPEPDMSSIPQDAATIPHSATPQVLTGRTQHTPHFMCAFNSLYSALLKDTYLPLCSPHVISLYLHQQAGQHGPQPGQEEDPAAPRSLWTRPAVCGAPAGRPRLHRQRLPAENSVHSAHTRLRGRKDIRCCTKTSLRCCFLFVQ